MPNSVKALIDRASERVGNPHRLAKALGVASSQVYDWRDGRLTCSPADRARIAAFAGEDAVQELVRATLETAKGEVRREQLQRVLGKLSQATIGVLGTALLAVTSLTSEPTEAASYFIRCIELLNRKRHVHS
jgi:DNA-binding transcriptional regulator YdaS (Cro superfamily)